MGSFSQSKAEIFLVTVTFGEVDQTLLCYCVVCLSELVWYRVFLSLAFLFFFVMKNTYGDASTVFYGGTAQMKEMQG